MSDPANGAEALGVDRRPSLFVAKPTRTEKTLLVCDDATATAKFANANIRSLVRSMKSAPYWRGR
ncbi:MAG: hypothetical protein GY844_31895 [Bradyrhizobium sp.]|nr:hypothetical protein [Bradyrhizobium sp.]